MKRILLIDDDEGMLSLLRHILEIGGHEVVGAASGREALRLLSEQPVDLVITDLIMPDMEGIEIIMHLRRKQPQLPIIAISGGARISAGSHLKLARKLGAVLALAKPFSPSELLEAVARVLAGPLGINPDETCFISARELRPATAGGSSSAPGDEKAPAPDAASAVVAG